ncbi:FGGY family carbohydrate kinase [Agreia sp. Leaf283]|uniref:FGGY family carbohydrate kinase n=1 Tax=Agreia sp. Leaf283 TaxID=1736321 RepID=UPI0006FFECF5|nr:FGGY family carbohydrate kinase [Agreia sp. Leaf283]KQP55865.1 glycerol kinase [Agreia sp. Leaf283]
MSKYVIAIDQGTTSSRAIIFNHEGGIVSTGQKEHEQIFPKAGWVEHNPKEIWDNVREVIGQALSKANLTRHDIVAVGITNQRETAVVWDKNTGEPVYNAIVWQDTRTQSIVDRLSADGGGDRFKDTVGLPLSTYFAGTKIVWILENVEGARERAEAGDLIFGTTDTWVLWNLTGGVNGGVHATDVTNASRTLFLDLKTLEWDDEILKAFDVPKSMLPEVRSSSEVYGTVSDSSLLREVPVAGILNTYGTGNFLIFNTGTDIVKSENGLLTTIGYKLGDGETHYALEGSIAVTGSLVQWLRDNLGIIQSAPDIEVLAKTVDDNGGAYFVPAFSGLFAPHWRSDARGALVGLTRFVNKGHIARAALESIAFQTREVLDAVNADSGVPLTELKVDGGATANDTLLQFQADILNVPVVRPVVAETTALGAAYAAGLAVGYWDNLDDLRKNWQEDQRWTPNMDDAERERLYRNWKKAVTKTLDWVDEDVIE